MTHVEVLILAIDDEADGSYTRMEPAPLVVILTVRALIDPAAP
jgi:hypothetical protein